METLAWYIKFYEDGRDIKKMLQDHENAQKKIKELATTLEKERKHYALSLYKKTKVIEEFKEKLKMQ